MTDDSDDSVESKVEYLIQEFDAVVGALAKTNEALTLIADSLAVLTDRVAQLESKVGIDEG